MLIFKRVYKKKRKKKRKTKAEKEESILRRKWGMDVKKLNKYTCCITGITDKKKLIAHHLDSYHTHPEKRFDLENGVVLEKTLHKKFHKIYGYKSTIRSQFIEFLLQESKLMADKVKGNIAKTAADKGKGSPRRKPVVPPMKPKKGKEC